MINQTVEPKEIIQIDVDFVESFTNCFVVLTIEPEFDIYSFMLLDKDTDKQIDYIFFNTETELYSFINGFSKTLYFLCNQELKIH